MDSPLRAPYRVASAYLPAHACLSDASLCALVERAFASLHSPRYRGALLSRLLSQPHPLDMLRSVVALVHYAPLGASPPLTGDASLALMSGSPLPPVSAEGAVSAAAAACVDLSRTHFSGGGRPELRVGCRASLRDCVARLRECAAVGESYCSGGAGWGAAAATDADARALGARLFGAHGEPPPPAPVGAEPGLVVSTVGDAPHGKPLAPMLRVTAGLELLERATATLGGGEGEDDGEGGGASASLLELGLSAPSPPQGGCVAPPEAPPWVWAPAPGPDSEGGAAAEGSAGGAPTPGGAPGFSRQRLHTRALHLSLAALLPFSSVAALQPAAAPKSPVGDHLRACCGALARAERAACAPTDGCALGGTEAVKNEALVSAAKRFLASGPWVPPPRTAGVPPAVGKHRVGAPAAAALLSALHARLCSTLLRASVASAWADALAEAASAQGAAVPPLSRAALIRTLADTLLRALPRGAMVPPPPAPAAAAPSARKRGASALGADATPAGAPAAKTRNAGSSGGGSGSGGDGGGGGGGGGRGGGGGGGGSQPLAMGGGGAPAPTRPPRMSPLPLPAVLGLANLAFSTASGNEPILSHGVPRWKKLLLRLAEHAAPGHSGVASEVGLGAGGGGCGGVEAFAEGEEGGGGSAAWGAAPATADSGFFASLAAPYQRAALRRLCVLAEELLAPVAGAPAAQSDAEDDAAAAAVLRAVSAAAGEKLEKQLKELQRTLEVGTRGGAVTEARAKAKRWAAMAARTANTLVGPWSALFVARWSALIYEAKANDYRVI